MAEEIIGGYKLLKCMMTGQSSQVWEVVEVTSHRHFAMKLLLPEKAKSTEHRKLLMHEAAVGKELSHPNVIRIQSIGNDKEHCYYVMEFFPSGSASRANSAAGRQCKAPRATCRPSRSAASRSTGGPTFTALGQRASRSSRTARRSAARRAWICCRSTSSRKRPRRSSSIPTS